MVCKTNFMSKNDYPKTRISAAVVKCDYCDHTGSARGLFTHVRLAHPGIKTKPKTSTRIMAHPNDIRGVGRHIETIKTIKTKPKKEGEYDWLIPIATKVLENVMREYGLLPSKVEKPNIVLNGIREKLEKRKIK